MAKKCPECGLGWPDFYEGCPYCIVRLLDDLGGKMKIKVKSKAEVEKDLKMEVVKKDPARHGVPKQEENSKRGRKKKPSSGTKIRGRIGRQIEAYLGVTDEK